MERGFGSKNGLDTVFKNHPPASNVSFISKVTERAVFLQTDNHTKKHELYLTLQSAYRKNQTTETALLKVTNDILMEMNSQPAVLLELLDLSAAFDTVDHSILLRRLQTSFGISGAPLDWFKSYLSARSQRVSIPGALSSSIQYGLTSTLLISGILCWYHRPHPLNWTQFSKYILAP